ncbi:MAG: aminodeoxychorismate synthase component I [Cyclobacteriaceae bacterium]
MRTKSEAIQLMNDWGAQGVPFLFFTDFLAEQIFIRKVEDVSPEEVLYDFNGVTNSLQKNVSKIKLKKQPIRIETFGLAFDKVIGEIKYGNSFLTNLTFETPVDCDGSLTDIFHNTRAKYKLRFADQFVCFSPEIFVSISENQVRSFPMKGTIDASLPNAREQILNDPKELAEHVTIVDLIRNDLSQIATDVRVDRFRYIDEIQTERGKLLQVSSEIVGELEESWKNALGDLLFSLLPAGSICGAPKPKTIRIITSVEAQSRGFYTGVCGLFDGKKLDSGVMIRYIEKRDDQLFYRSGGGITAFSDLEKEYQEYMDKIYLPL